MAESDPQVMLRLEEKRSAIEGEGLEFAIKALNEAKAQAESEEDRQLKSLKTELDHLRAAFSERQDGLTEETEFLGAAFSFSLWVTKNSERYRKDRNFQKRLETNKMSKPGRSFENSTAPDKGPVSQNDVDYLRLVSSQKL